MENMEVVIKMANEIFGALTKHKDSGNIGKVVKSRLEKLIAMNKQRMQRGPGPSVAKMATPKLPWLEEKDLDKLDAFDVIDYTGKYVLISKNYPVSDDVLILLKQQDDILFLQQ